MKKLLVHLTEEELKDIVNSASREAFAEAIKAMQPKEKPSHEQASLYLTKKQAASTLNCSPSTIDNAARSGKLTRHYIGKTVRFRKEEVYKLAVPKS